MNEQQHVRETLVSSGALSGDRLAWVAIGLSLMAVLVSVVEVSFLRNESRAQAWPYLQLHNSYSELGYSFYIENKGVGPAKVRSVEFRIDDEILTDLDAAIVAALGEEEAFSYDLYKIGNPAPGVMSADEKMNLFSVPWQNNTRRLAEVWAGRVDIVACYCSIYDDCWLASLKGKEPQPVKACR